MATSTENVSRATVVKLSHNIIVQGADGYFHSS